MKDFHGKPIIVYSIETARKSGLFEAGIWVSTEDPKIAKVAWDAGAMVHPRSAALAQDHVGTQEVTAAALQELFPGRATRPDFACCIYATAPLMSPYDLRVGFAMVAARVKPYAYAVGPDGKHAGQWYWGDIEAFLSAVPLEANAYKVQIPAARVCDINVEADWEQALRQYQELHPAGQNP